MQGMTLDRVELKLDDAFDYGQAYVTLSRVTSLDGLWIRGGAVTQAAVRAHPDVTEFYKRELALGRDNYNDNDNGGRGGLEDAGGREDGWDGEEELEWEGTGGDGVW